MSSKDSLGLKILISIRGKKKKKDKICSGSVPPSSTVKTSCRGTLLGSESEMTYT